MSDQAIILIGLVFLIQWVLIIYCLRRIKLLEEKKMYSKPLYETSSRGWDSNFCKELEPKKGTCICISSQQCPYK